MSSLIFETTTRWLCPLLLLFSLFALVVGHHEPGGGFVGGLLAASAFVLLVYSRGGTATRRLLRVDPLTLFGAGLAVALASGLPSLLGSRPFLSSSWWTFDLAVFGELKIGTPLVFDVGVYLVVVGVVTAVVLELAEED